MYSKKILILSCTSVHLCKRSIFLFSQILFYFCLDDNQCSNGNGGCDHKCTNKIPDFECDCRQGYVLEKDGKTCKGKNNLARIYRTEVRI